MNFGEMIARTDELLEKETEDDEVFLGQLKHAVNTAYMTVARDKWRPAAAEEMCVCKGKIPIAELSECFVGLKSVKWNGLRVGAWAGKDFIHVCENIQKVIVEYYYLPVPMEEDEDEPVIPFAQVDPYAYIYFAASLYCSIRHLHAEAAVWDSRYRNVVDNVKEVRSGFTLPAGRWR